MRSVKHRRVGQTAGRGGKGFTAGPRREDPEAKNLPLTETSGVFAEGCGRGGNVEHSLEHFFATIVKYERHREMCINIT